MIAIGIDPGLRGAVAFLYEDAECLVIDTPMLDVATARRGTRRRYDLQGMHAMLGPTPTEPIGGAVVVAIEEQQAFPGRDETRRCVKCKTPYKVTVHQGAVATFTTGRGMGIWEAFVVARGYPYVLVRPRDWKRAMLHGLDPADKRSSLIIARRLFPGADLGRAKDAGRAEALLIAEFARRHWGEIGARRQ